MSGGEEAQLALQILKSWNSGTKVKKEVGETAKTAEYEKSNKGLTMPQTAVLFSLPIWQSY